MSPGRSPIAAAGVLALTWSTVVVGVCSVGPIQKTTQKMRKASRMFTAGPARMVTMRFHGLAA